LDIDWPTVLLTFVCGAEYFSRSASTLKPGDTGLTLNFGNALLKKDKNMLSTRIFRKYQGSEQDVNVCVLWWNIE
jgi:hypothetical protein